MAHREIMDVQIDDYRPDTVRAVIVSGNRVLMVQTRQLKPENVGKWCLPGGKIDPNDATLPDTLRRELHEELSVRALIHEKIDLWEEQREGYIRLHHIFRVTLPHTRLTPDPVEIHGLRWFTLAEAHAAPVKLGYELRAISRVLDAPTHHPAAAARRGYDPYDFDASRSAS